MRSIDQKPFLLVVFVVYLTIPACVCSRFPLFGTELTLLLQPTILKTSKNVAFYTEIAQKETERCCYAHHFDTIFYDTSVHHATKTAYMMRKRLVLQVSIVLEVGIESHTYLLSLSKTGGKSALPNCK